MEEVQYRKWSFCIDAKATREVYQRVRQGEAENCDCPNCQNFVLSRQYIFPEEIRGLFECCGIDIKKEREVSYDGIAGEGLHRYAGWFHFIGVLKSKNSSAPNNLHELVFQPVSPNFQIRFVENDGFFWEEFADYPLVQVEFIAEVPWLLGIDEQTW